MAQPVWNPDPDFAIQDRRKGCYIPVRFSDDCTPTAVKWTLSSSPCSSGRATDAIRGSRRAGGPEEEGYFPVDATAERDAPYQSDYANTLGACPESDVVEVQEIHHPSPGQHRRLAPRATFSAVEAAPKGNGYYQLPSSALILTQQVYIDSGVTDDICHALLRSMLGEDYRTLVPSLCSLRKRCPWIQLRDSS